MTKRVTDALASRFEWEFVALIMVEAGMFVCQAVTSTTPTEIHAGYSRPLGSGVVGTVAATAEPILLDDVRMFPGYVSAALPFITVIRLIGSLPLRRPRRACPSLRTM
jgi:putative methionine-R-sulfoxide reductase with GAF domain